MSLASAALISLVFGLIAARILIVVLSMALNRWMARMPETFPPNTTDDELQRIPASARRVLVSPRVSSID